jgi:hypothetical protein
MIRWQYQIVNIGTFNNAERMIEALADLGADGWELAATYDKASNWFAGFERGFLLFKRPVDGEPEGPWARQYTFRGDEGQAW